MTSLPLISHRMFVAAIQEDGGSHPAPAPARVLDASGAESQDVSAALAAEHRTSDVMMPEQPVPAMET